MATRTGAARPSDDGGPSALLVFGDDGSTAADVAWEWVGNHRWAGWRAEVVTATPPPFPPVSWDEAVVAVEWESAHPRRPNAGSGLASVRHLTAVSDPRLLLGDRRDASLLVVGPSGVGSLRAVLLGSTTEWLLQHAPAPLAVVRSPEPVGSVLLCVDGSGQAQRAVDAFGRLPWAAGTDAVVLTVADGAADVEAGQEMAAKSLAAAGIATSTRVVPGRATRAILEQVDLLRPQLVVLGSRGTSPWRGPRLGSTAGAVARAAPCSCLVTSAGEPAAGARRQVEGTGTAATT